MKRKYGLLLLILAFLASGMSSLFSDDYEIEQIKKKLPKLLGANNVGKDFWFTIPPCYEVGGNNFIKIFVTTPANTIIYVNVPGKGWTVQKKSVPNDVVEFNITPSVGQAYSHDPGKVPPAEKVYRGMGIHVYADQPLVVYCVIRYQATSDGFLAFPASSLGKDYISCSYADMGAMYNGNYPSEMGIVSPHDDNVVKFTMGGNIVSKTAGNMKPGETKTEVMQKGDVWMFSSYGYEGDLTGSKIVSSKPVGVVSGNFCTNIPTTNRWCDYTVEMDIPTFTWGLNYHVGKIHGRRYASLIRIFAKEKNTKLFRDGIEIGKLTDAGGLLGKGWLEMRLVPMGYEPSSAVISGDKPIGVTLCNTGVQEDGAPMPNSDPFIMGITPMEQYQKEITFATPGIKGVQNFKENYFNLVYGLDENGLMPDDIEFAVVRAGEFVWEPVKTKFTGSDEIFKFDVNGKKYGLKNITLPADGVYKLRAEKPFAAYSYGYDWCDSYGFPTSAALMDLEKPDTIAPYPTWLLDCTGSTIDAKVRDMPEDVEVRSNLAMVVFDSEESFNYRFLYDDFIPGMEQEISWSLEVIDKKRDARAVITFTDRRGNDTTIIINYYAIKISMEPELLDWGVMKLGQEEIKKYTIKNLSTQSSVKLDSHHLKFGNKHFELLDVTLPFELKPKEVKEFRVKFKAEEEGTFTDYIGMGDTCVFEYWTELRAYVGEPVIEVTDINFPAITVGKKASKTFFIKNLGTVDLRITGYQGNFLSVYTHDLRKLSEQNPLIIPFKGDDVPVNVDFIPDAEGNFNDSIVFISDAGTKIDNVALITGIGIKPGLIANGYDWGRCRIDRPNHKRGPYDTKWVPGQPDAILLENDGSQEVQVNIEKVVTVKGEQSSFIFKQSDFTLTLQAGEKKLIKVEFQPKTVGEHEIEIIFESTASTPTKSVLKGIGIVPRAKTEDMDFGLTLIKDENNIQKRQIKVTNEAYEWQDTLTITNFISQPNSDDISTDLLTPGKKGFRYDYKTLLTDRGGKIILAPDSSVTIDAEFVAQFDGTHSASLVTVSDAETEVTTNWKGEGRFQAMVVDGDESNICTGEEDILEATITNTGTYDLVMSTIEFDPIMPEFSFVDPNDAVGFTLKPGESKTIKVKYTPTKEGEFKTNLVFNNDSKDNPAIAAVLDCEAQHFDRISSLSPATQTKTIGEEAIISINMNEGERIDFADLQIIDIDINYTEGHEFLKPSLIKLGSALSPANYRIATGYPKINEKSGTISVRLEALGNADFDVTGELLNVRFMTYLPVGLSSTAKVDHTLMPIDNSCVTIKQEPAVIISLNPICVGNLMHVRKIFGENTISLIKPNPAGPDGADIDFTTALDGWAEIRVFNTNGELMLLPLSSNLKAGEYTFRLDTKDLPSGSYTVQFRAGNEVKSQNLNIVK